MAAALAATAWKVESDLLFSTATELAHVGWFKARPMAHAVAQCAERRRARRRSRHPRVRREGLLPVGAHQDPRLGRDVVAVPGRVPRAAAVARRRGGPRHV